MNIVLVIIVIGITIYFTIGLGVVVNVKELGDIKIIKKDIFLNWFFYINTLLKLQELNYTNEECIVIFGDYFKAEGKRAVEEARLFAQSILNI